MERLCAISFHPMFSVPRSRVSVLRKIDGTPANLSHITRDDSSRVPFFILLRNTTPLTRSLMDLILTILCRDTIVSSSKCPTSFRLSTTVDLSSMEGNTGLSAFCACLKPFFCRLVCLRGRNGHKSSHPAFTFPLPPHLTCAYTNW